MDTSSLYLRIARLQNEVKHWCPVVSSSVIKSAIISRCDEIGVSLAEVCASCGVKYKPVKEHWINTSDAVSRPTLRADHIIKIGLALGIDIRTLVVMKDIDRHEKRKEILKGEFIRG